MAFVLPILLLLPGLAFARVTPGSASGSAHEAEGFKDVGTVTHVGGTKHLGPDRSVPATSPAVPGSPATNSGAGGTPGTSPIFQTENVAPLLRIYGAAGTFGSLSALPFTPTGQALATTAISGWGFLPGQSAYFPAVGSDGTVLIANEPQTDNQLLPTARQMVVSSFNPTTQQFRNIVVPTSTGKTELGGAWPAASGVVGGGDVSDIGAVQVGGAGRIAFTSAMPFWGWNAASGGEFPTLGYLTRSSTGDWAIDAKDSLTASTIATRTSAAAASAARAAKKSAAAARAAKREAAAAARLAKHEAAAAGAATRGATSLRATRLAAARSTATSRATKSRAAAARAARAAKATAACAAKDAPGIGKFGDCHMPAELAQLPASGDLVMTQYAFDDAARPSGRISVVDAKGRVQASYAYPKIVLPNGSSLAVHPREVDADPLGTTGDERFVVIFDAETGTGTAGAPASPGAVQEFRFDASAGTIIPTSAPVLSGDLSGGQKLGFETAQYGSDGSLWITQSLVGTLQAGPLAIYHRVAGSGSVLGDRPSCGASPSWRGQAWGRTCAPDERIDAATPLGIGRSLNEDPGTGAMVLTTMSGYLLPIAPAATAASSTSHVAGAPVNLGLDRLADRSVVAIGPRKAVEDTTTRKLWIPIQQLATTHTCAAWPCTPRSLDQWLYEVDLSQLLGPVTRSAAGSRARLANAHTSH